MTGGGGDEVKVLGSWASPFSTRVRIALNLKGIDYHFLPEPFGDKSELRLKSNPVYKKIPVLIHNGNPICESMIIIEYIDDVWTSVSGNHILPADAYDRSTARFWAAYIDDKLYHAIRGIILAHTEEAKAEAAEQLPPRLLLLEAAFKKCSKGKGFFGGETIGYLDIALGSYLSWLVAVGEMTGFEFLDGERMPLLVGWAERFRSDEAVKVVMPEVDELLEVAKMMKDRFGDAPPAAE